MTGQKKTFGNHLLEAYEKMVERLVLQLQGLSDKAAPEVERRLTLAKQKAVELGELTVQEAEQIAGVLWKDLRSAGRHLASGGKELEEWLEFDANQVEARFLELFSSAADQTAIELLNLRERAWEAEHYQTGEVTGPGTLVCAACQQQVHFHAPGHVPPCPKCHGSLFARSGDSGNGDNHGQ